VVAARIAAVAIRIFAVMLVSIELGRIVSAVLILVFDGTQDARTALNHD
jgi:hypothetical protein